MNTHRANPPSAFEQLQDAEAGYMLIGVLVLVAMLLIALAVAAPRVASDLQRDKEEELVHRGLQYSHAIRLYYKKFGRNPASLDQLEKTNEIRFLRKRYKDPITGKDEWRLIHFGEAKVPATGLFGQAIANIGAGGTALSGGTPQSGLTDSFGSSGGPGAAQPGIGGGSGSLGGVGSGQNGGGSGVLGGSVGIGNTNGPGTTPPGTDAPGTGQPGIGATGQTFGGGGIVGVSSTSPKASIREYRKQKHYNEWEFTYDPRQELNGQNGRGRQQPGANIPANPIGVPDTGQAPTGGPGSPTPPPMSPQ